GPTEATVGCMIHRYDSERDERGSVPIGRPAANTKIYLLDEKMRPVAENMMGEICIGGECLAEGYWGREELSKEKFIENPFKEGERIYRSGDVGRWLREGEVEYIGRRDEQVKYHGHRVELGEIAAAVKEHGEVREAVVMIRKEKELGEVMVCYYVSREEIESGELREFVKERVIEETVPGMYVHMKRMPLTLNGKVDVRVLPGIEGIWGEVLGLERVGVTESFFEMGGHSLLATQVVSRVREVMKVEIGLRKMFEKATVRGLAEEVERQMREGERVEVEGIERVSREGELPLSFAQQRLWFLNQLEPGSTAYNIPIGIRLKGKLDVEGLEEALKEIVRRHETLRTVFSSVEGRPVQVIKEEGDVRLE